MVQASADTAVRDAEPTPYDLVPYESHSFDFSQPDRLHAVGQLFGMAPADFRTARVLELGCAGGGNILPLAVRYPDAHFTGVDLSSVQIDHARDLARDMKVANATFHCMSITDITPAFGSFDYIIVHGVFSWVPAPVRDAVIAVAAHNLSANGIALISYNTLPGWNQVRTVRDMMLYHCARFATLQEKIDQGIALLRFVLDSAHVSLTAYRETIQSELETLTSQRAYYIFHEHLENENYSLHVHEMAALARAQGLDYLADAHLEIMNHNNFPAPVAQALAAADDIVRIEQYLDFLTNRRFRVSLFCKNDVPLRRGLDAAKLLDFNLGSRLAAPPPGSDHLTRDVKTIFKMLSGLEITTDNRYAAAVVQTLTTLGHRIIAAEDAVREAAALLAAAGGSGDASVAEIESRMRAALVECGMRLVFVGGLTLHSAPSSFVRAVSDRPNAFAAARAISKHEDIVPNLTHMRITLDESSRVLLRACDGTRDRAALTDRILDALKGGELQMHRDGAPVAGSAAARADVAAWIETMLVQFAALGLLAG